MKANKSALNLLDCASLIHEATHAVSDTCKIDKTPNIDCEAVDYIAQALYLYGKHPIKTGRLRDATNAAELSY